MPVSKLLKFPMGSYLMVRLDYVIVCGDELEAKIMRLIEMYMEDERRRLYQQLLNDPKSEITPDDVVEITKDVWASISHRLFMNDLYGLIKSENTLKRAIKSLQDKKFIRVTQPTKQYEAPTYQIDIEVVQAEFDKLAKQGKAGYQKLIPSKSDTIKKRYHQNLTPSGEQNLIPSSQSPSVSMVSEIDTNSIKDDDKKKDTVEESANAPTPAMSQSSHFFPNDEERQKYNIFIRGARKEVAKANNGTRHSRTIKVTIPKRPTQQPITMPVSPEAQRILDDWQSLFKRAIVITQKDIEAAERFVKANPTKQELWDIRAWLFDTDNPQKPWYKKIGVGLPDIEKNFGKWQSIQEVPQKNANNGHSPESNGTKPRPSALVSEEQAKKNKDRLYALAAAEQAKKAEGKS